jgi:hypothetical protein
MEESTSETLATTNPLLNLMLIAFIAFTVAELLGIYAGFQINPAYGILGITNLVLRSYGPFSNNIIFWIVSLFLVYIGTQLAFKINQSVGWILLILMGLYILSLFLFAWGWSQQGK